MQLRKHYIEKGRGRSWRGVVFEGLLLIGLWLHLSGKFDFFHIALGLVIVALVMFINAPLKDIKFFKDDYFAWDCLQYGALICYIPWLVSEIVIASFQVAYLVLHPQMPVTPHLVKFRVNMPNLAAKVILGNSITLTPGTVTIELSGDQFLVHALTQQSAENLVNGKMPTKVARLFDLSASEVVSDVTMFQISEGS